MPIDFFQFLFFLGMYTFVALVLVFIMIFLAHVLMPRRMLKTYFKPPYFKEGEVIMFTGFPFGYIRTVMFMRLMAYPSSGAKRGLTQAFEMAPVWFRIFSKLVLLSFAAVGGLFMLIMLIFFFEVFIIHPDRYS